jgi:hypothetical protein
MSMIESITSDEQLRRTQLADSVWDVIAFREEAGDSYVGPDALQRQLDLQTLAGGFLIGPDEIGKAIADSCRPPGLGINRDRTTRAHLILARPLGSPMNYWRFDNPDALPDLFARQYQHPMHLAVRLLRLARPNHIGFGVAARVTIENGQPTRIYPNELLGAGAFAFIAPRPRADERGLRLADLALFNRLWSHFNSRDIPARIQESLVWFERSAWESNARTRLPLSVTAVESLLNTRDDSSTAQFVLRLQGLVDQGLIPPALWHGADLASVYTLRSCLVHGRPVGTDEQREVERLMSQLEESTRQLLRNVILDDTVADHFRTDSSIERLLPVSDGKMKRWYEERRSCSLPSWLQMRRQ